MNVEITDACNLNCPFCLRPREGGTFMSIPFFTKIARFQRSRRHRAIGLHWRGEPCFHPRLHEMAEISRNLGFKNIWLSTNTATKHLHNEEYVTKLMTNLHNMTICVDGYNQETVGKYRVGANWNTMMKNLKAIGDVDAGCKKSMRVLMFKYNDGHEDFFRDLARKHNIPRINFVSPVIHSKNVDSWMSNNPRYQRYVYEDDVWNIKRVSSCTPKVLKKSSFIISVHGQLHPCCFDQDLEYPLGHVLEDPWSTIEANFQALGQKMLNRKLSMCHTCCIPSEKIYHWETVT